MFSGEDVREVLGLFPPPVGHIAALPSLVQSVEGLSLVTLSHLQQAFGGIITQTSSRLPISDLSQQLNVGHDVITTLVLSQPEMALLSDGGDHVIPKVERDGINESLQEVLTNGIVSKKEFAQQAQIHTKSVERLVGLQEEQLVHYDDHVCTGTYETMLSEFISREIDAVMGNQYNTDIYARDLEQMPGSPPKWLVLSHLQRLVESRQLDDEVFVLELPELIRVQSKHFRGNNIQAWAMRLLSGELAYIDLEVLLNCWRSILYDSIDSVLSDFRALEGVKVVETFALSERWISKLVDQRLRGIHYKDEGAVDVAKDLGEKIQHGEKSAYAPGGYGHPHRLFPEKLYGNVVRMLEQSIEAALAEKPYTQYHRFGTIVLTDEQYIKEQEQLIESAKQSAATQWEQLKEKHENEIKFTISSPPDASVTSTSVQEALLKEKPTQKACDDQFWSTITELEAQNESAFATFWTDRVISRAHIYNAGLPAISDQKLHDQLADLLATYIQKELVPESISKARSQGLVLSRRTKKNISKLESTLSTAKDLPSLLTTLDKFTTKQTIPTPSPDQLAEYKSSMLQDLRRRMAKHQKPSDGPVLFLTLVVILFAKHNDGIVYATGKYAPKVLKLLKGKMDAEEYKMVEKWKEGAKTGTLRSEDREGMRGMAGA
ncbi:hypothetical protein FB567DRAFT_259475 [Paraphoma chrysanthemicola]|uniref:E3 UFM1-protein ligase-like C-terminal domain-containing protein n=1 Tax=Paraphoma chrysanthemicola TaxID=798071 RepID=A0A8K0VR96_9PLEO|nr:hypothetical protein FB567DRAFT_259475 [Paraphoma chrysanthemicola]